MTAPFRNPFAVLWAATFAAVFVWSLYHPKDLATWFLEVIPAIVIVALMLATWTRFPLSPLLYWFVLVHSVILMIGGHYTYAEVPFFDHLFGMERNNYDKLGHFAQGFVPALAAREILIRNRVVNGRVWTGVLTICVCLAISAFYELIEWWVALASDEAAEAFLGTQGYVWDTQSDMGWALMGAVAAVLTLSPLHDRQIGKLECGCVDST